MFFSSLFQKRKFEPPLYKCILERYNQDIAPACDVRMKRGGGTMSQNRVFTLETDFLRYGFDEKGRTVEFADRLTGKNYAEPGSPAFALYEGNGDISTGVTRSQAYSSPRIAISLASVSGLQEM